MFLHVSVILSTGGGLRPGPPGTRQTPPGPGRPPWDQADPPGPGRPPRTRQTPPDQADPPGRRLYHTVNEWLVLILLECILVVQYFFAVKKGSQTIGTRMHSSRMRTTRYNCHVSSQHALLPGGCTCPGGCTLPRGVYLPQGVLPCQWVVPVRGCTHARGVYLPWGGVPAEGVYTPCRGGAPARGRVYLPTPLKCYLPSFAGRN